MAKTGKAKAKTTTTVKKVTKKPATVTKKVAPKKKTKAAVATKPEFFQVRVTDQSLYWLIFGAVAILFAMWVYTLDSRVRDMYDQIDMNTTNIDAALETQLNKQEATQEAAPTTE